MKKFSLALLLILLFGLAGDAFVEFYWPRRSMPGHITSAIPPGAAPNVPAGVVPPPAAPNAAGSSNDGRGAGPGARQVRSWMKR